jgi:hypothetical protein
MGSERRAINRAVIHGALTRHGFVQQLWSVLHATACSELTVISAAAPAASAKATVARIMIFFTVGSCIGNSRNHYAVHAVLSLR